ncbi:hypothetical protein D9758_005103 [Tetrapyrgos nigripes]|uniref:F-box domain-containing protein n=1 Tax=Tetrapyrgos nigripes TaxID=182062 RepID=A0A8H5LWI5_9AGAR|nr:hypothetical protein D9758_005103 [Tetrapyrgos nigripes]
MAYLICHPLHPRITQTPDKITEALRSPVGSFYSLLNNISQHIQEGEVDLSNLTTRILALESTLKTLKQEQESLQVYLNRCRSAVAPIRCLPFEIMDHIFVLASECNRFSLDAALHKDPIAFSLAAVCRSWRDVALATPRIWSSLAIRIMQGERWLELRSDSLTTVIDLCLARSRHLPLSVTLDLQNINSIPRTVMERLVSESHRWCNLTISLNSRLGRFAEEKILSTITELPALAALECSNATDALVRLSQGLKKAPKLASLKLVNSEWPHQKIANMSSLTSLELDGDVVPEGTEWVPRCPNLTHLSLWALQTTRSYRRVRDIPAGSRSITSLSVMLWTHVDCVTGELLRNLELPLLTSLSLTGPSEYPGPCEKALNTLWGCISHSGCTLSSLRLDNVPIDDKAFITLLKLIPSLTEIIIDHHDPTLHRPLITDALFQAMQLPGKQKPTKATKKSTRSTVQLESPPDLLLPKLQQLSLKVGCQTFKSKQFVDMVSSRRNLQAVYVELGAKCLQLVELIVLDEANDGLDAYEALFELKEEGLRVEVKIPEDEEVKEPVQDVDEEDEDDEE